MESYPMLCPDYVENEINKIFNGYMHCSLIVLTWTLMLNVRINYIDRVSPHFFLTYKFADRNLRCINERVVTKIDKFFVQDIAIIYIEIYNYIIPALIKPKLKITRILK